MADVKDREVEEVEVWEPRTLGTETVGTAVLLKQPREWTNLVVIDIGDTIFDPDTGENLEQQASMKSYLHKFLRSICMMYDILIWSKTTRDIIESKIQRFELLNNPDYNIIGYMDKHCMGQMYGVYHKIPLKRLNFVWDLFPRYNMSDTVLCDNIGMCNMLRHRDNVIPVGSRLNLDEGGNNELMKLAEYLTKVYKSPSVCNFSHFQWHENVGYQRIRKRKCSVV